MTEETTKPTLFKDLWDRRFFQYFATYIGASWAAIQFGEWMVNRYGFSDNLIEKIIVFLLICLPAFLVFVYNHGRPGVDTWKPIEKILVPGSLILATVVSIFAIKGPDRAMTAAASVSIETEDGKVETRLVPTIESTRRAVFFPFVNKLEKSTENWLRFGIPYLMDKDIEQDMRIYSIDATDLKYDYEAFDLDYSEDASLSSMVKIAQDNYSDYFVTGTYEHGINKVINVKVYDTNSAKLFFEKKLEGKDYYDLVDEFSEELTNKIYLNKEFGDSKTTIDLPSRDLITSNIEGFKNFISGELALGENVNDPKTAAAFFGKTIALDDKCSECYAGLAVCSSIQMDVSTAQKHASKAINLSASLPERQRLKIQQLNYQLKQKPEKGRKLLETWMKLYPSDYRPYSHLIGYYSQTLEWDKAKEIGQKAFAAGHRGNLLTRLANLYIATDDFDTAEKYLLEFEDRYPHKAKKSGEFADLYIKKGDWGKAKEHLEKINITNPGDINTLLKLGDLEEKTGNYQEALGYIDEALMQCDHVQDTVKVYESFEKYYTRFGQIKKVLEYQDKRLEMLKTFNPVVNIEIAKLQLGVRYTWIGQEDIFKEHAEYLKNTYGSQNPVISCVADWLFYLFTEQAEEFKKSNTDCGAMMYASAGENMKYFTDGMLHKFAGEYGKAAESYQIYIDSTGVGGLMMGVEMSEVFRKSGNVKKAKNFIDDILKTDPSQTTYLLELAKVQLANGDKALAKKTVDQCLEIWKNADPEYKYYQDAKDFRASL